MPVKLIGKRKSDQKRQTKLIEKSQSAQKRQTKLLESVKMDKNARPNYWKA